jgi:CDP-glucose 4,6-dehydratase
MTDKHSFNDRSVLITGATGVVGSWLVESLLDDGARPVVLLRDEVPGSALERSGRMLAVTRVRGALENLRLLVRTIAEYEISAVFHLGAQTQVMTADKDPYGTLEANVRGTYNILEAVRLSGTKISTVVASSDKAYGPTTSLPYRETHPLAGRGIYEASKSAADLVATAYASTYGLPIAIARCGNVYGGGDLNWDRIVPGTIRAVLRGRAPVLRSTGSPRRDYLYVRDAADAYVRVARALEAGAAVGEAYNFGHGIPVSVLEIVSEILTVMGHPELEPIIEGRAGREIPDQWLDSSKAERELAWRPRFSLEEGLVETVKWYEGFLAS